MKEFGFKLGQSGVHSSRTMMLEDIKNLLNHSPQNATKEEYIKIIIEDNILAKKTLSTRKTSSEKLVGLYGLSLDILLFGVFRELYYIDKSSVPMLALLCALARDPLLRSTTNWIMGIPHGETAKKEKLIEYLKAEYQDIFFEKTISSMARNILSSWSQSGHLKGGRNKTRVKPRITPTIFAYALFLSYLNGLNGKLLFSSQWAKVCDLSLDNMIAMAQEASRDGIIDLKMMGDVIECRFPRFLSKDEEVKIREQN